MEVRDLPCTRPCCGGPERKRRVRGVSVSHHQLDLAAEEQSWLDDRVERQLPVVLVGYSAQSGEEGSVEQCWVQWRTRPRFRSFYKAEKRGCGRENRGGGPMPFLGGIRWATRRTGGGWHGGVADGVGMGQTYQKNAAGLTVGCERNTGCWENWARVGKDWNPNQGLKFFSKIKI
jgi:hypothetical protein